MRIFSPGLTRVFNLMFLQVDVLPHRSNFGNTLELKTPHPDTEVSRKTGWYLLCLVAKFRPQYGVGTLRLVRLDGVANASCISSR